MQKEATEQTGAGVIASLVRGLSDELMKVNTKISDMAEKRAALETRLREAVLECNRRGIVLGSEFDHITDGPPF